MLAKSSRHKYRKNRKNNKYHKIHDFGKEEAKRDPEMSANTAKVTRIFHASQDTYYKYRNNSECNKILEKEEAMRGFDLLNNKRKHGRAIALQFSLSKF